MTSQKPLLGITESYLNTSERFEVQNTTASELYELQDTTLSKQDFLLEEIYATIKQAVRETLLYKYNKLEKRIESLEGLINIQKKQLVSPTDLYDKLIEHVLRYREKIHKGTNIVLYEEEEDHLLYIVQPTPIDKETDEILYRIAVDFAIEYGHEIVILSDGEYRALVQSSPNDHYWTEISILELESE